MLGLTIKKKNRRIIYLGLIAYLVFLLITLPASFLTRYILPSVDTARVVKLQSVRGSLWNGQANDTRVNVFNLGKLNWSLSAWNLLLGDINLDLNFKSEISNGNGEVTLGFGGAVAAEDVEFVFPAEMLQPLMSGFPISISGDFRGTVNLLNYLQNDMMQADGRFVWQGAAMRAPQNIEFGDFLIELTPYNKGTKIKITDENQGPVKTELSIKLDGKGQYNLNGWLQARDPGQQHITEALRFIGAREDNSGRFWVTKVGNIGSKKNIRGQRKVR